MNCKGITVINEPVLAERTSIRLGGTAIAEVCLQGPDGFEELDRILRILGGRMAVLGQGSNIIAADGQLPLVLVAQREDDSFTILNEEKERSLVRVAASMRLPRFLSIAAKLGLAGLEGLAGIPGSVGGAIAGNAGSFGMQIGDCLRVLRLYSPLLGLVDKKRDELDLAYRSCAIAGHKGAFIITGADFLLQKDRPDSIRERMEANLARKKASQPVSARSAGCVFKNPAPDAPAGRLLEEAGLRGFKAGGMAFSQVHANFLVNEGGGSFKQARELIERAMLMVREKSGYQLELEVKIWP
ncbi:UDP-N-acetylmuramate dehydrogenase [Desulfovibrio sp. OttesenSCG-928-A18]|nr:UDP-N-acetylmuramate dehydrogenase [Desulfovibrio sp. OttesenSCG-928-A18]